MPLSVEGFTISQAHPCQLCPGGRETSLTSGKKNLQSCRWLQLSCLQQLMQPKLRQPRQLGSLGSHGSSSSHGSRGDVAAASAVAAVASAAAAGVQHRRTITCGIARACVPVQNQFHGQPHVVLRELAFQFKINPTHMWYCASLRSSSNSIPRTITCGVARACVPIQNQFHDG